MKIQQPPYAIVVTFPVKFLMDLAYSHSAEEIKHLTNIKEFILAGYKELNRQIDLMIAHPDQSTWNHSKGNKPAHEVVFAYISCLGKICWKAKVAEFQPGHEKEFSDGRKKFAKNWLVLCDFVKAPHDIPFKGMQGFRYVEKMF